MSEAPVTPSGSSVRRCICPGSFDPVTVGHLDVIRRSARMYDEVIVVVLHNPDKTGAAFSGPERVELIEASLTDHTNVRVEAVANRLLVDVCRDMGVDVVVKGLRSESDFAYELPMAIMNRHLQGVETLLLPGAPELGHLSSSLVKQVAAMGGDVTGMVPDPVLGPLLERVRR